MAPAPTPPAETNDRALYEGEAVTENSFSLPPSNTLTSPPEVIIVGQGVAGAALAAYLGKHGRRVLAIERSLAEPQRIVGELLQPGGVEMLQQLGLEDCLLGFDAQEVEGYAVWFHDEKILTPYPEVNGKEKPRGRSFHHGKFIQKLRHAALTQQT
jgi:squalene monooxygenase